MRSFIIASFISISLFVPASSIAQDKAFTRIFQFSLTPGLSSNGFHPGGFNNFFSLNLTSGYSARNYLMEVAVISNLNEIETRGLQFAGLANLTGSNAFAGLREKEINKKLKEGFESNLSGLQISGLTNAVLNNVFGGQLTAGVNVAGGALQGTQVAGFFNFVKKYSFGVQLAGFGNVSGESMDGVQIASIVNYTSGGLYGVQLGVFNRASIIEGINSFNHSDPTGLQFGLINSSTSMNGFQIGLINLSKRMQGTQIGLINFFGNGKTPETRDGTTIGLINIGSSGYFSAYATETFLMNVKIATGTVKNRRMNNEGTEKQIQNSLIYSRMAANNNGTWGIGYGLKKFFFSRSTAPGFNKLKFLAWGIDFLHVNHEEKKFTRELSLLTRPEVSIGSRFHPKNKVFYFFAATSYNIYKSTSRHTIDTILKSAETETRTDLQQWPGFSVGVLVQ